ncbi:Neuroendocrine convertase 2 [Melipona bicolor]|uniref:Neuroendocrine convertase 2 n=1 Tax=Melipona bicolor TaxID=60889 RepID=A0AA40FEB3_9HYME|nr:Neuroendocrine convertase 2 [Melipona bicolor]
MNEEFPFLAHESSLINFIPPVLWTLVIDRSPDMEALPSVAMKIAVAIQRSSLLLAQRETILAESNHSITTKHTATTDLYGKCTTTHSGTSAAAPEAAGVFALALEANPQLTWRDIQHLTVLTSKRNSLFDAKGRFHWTMNGVGLEFNHLFGYGVLDAGAMVALAKKWKTVPPRYHCEAGSVLETQEVTSDRSILLKIKTDACAGTEYAVNYLEHVQAVISVNATRRGDLELFLTSPMGTRSMILSRRINDDDHRDGFTKWPFMTTHTWGEYPQGNWLLEVSFNTQTPQHGWIREWTLMLHGTREPPYTGLPAADPHSKLAIVKKAHEERSSAM